MRHLCRQRPSYPRIDFTHPLASGLVFAGLGGGASTLQYTDSSPYGNHGVLTNMEPATDWVFDQTLGRWCCDFDGSNDYVSISSIGVATNWTIVLWCYRTGTDYGGLFAPNSSGYYGLTDRSAAGNLQIAFDIGVDVAYRNDYGPLNQWVHMAVTYGSTKLLYLNGVVYPNVTTDWGGGTLGGPRVGGGLYAQHRSTDVMAFSRILSTAEIQQLADPSNVMLSGLILPPRRRLWAVGAVAPPTTNRRRRVLLAGVPR